MVELEHWVRVTEAYFGGGAGYVGMFVEKKSGRLKVTASPLGVGGYQEFPRERAMEAMVLYEKWAFKVGLMYRGIAA